MISKDIKARNDQTGHCFHPGTVQAGNRSQRKKDTWAPVAEPGSNPGLLPCSLALRSHTVICLIVLTLIEAKKMCCLTHTETQMQTSMKELDGRVGCAHPAARGPPLCTHSRLHPTQPLRGCYYQPHCIARETETQGGYTTTHIVRE